MLVSAQANAFDFAARSLDRRTLRVNERAEDERRRNARRRAQMGSERELMSAQVLSPFATREAATPGADATHLPQALSTDALWTLIDAVDGGGGMSPVAPPKDAAPEQNTASQAESLYLLLAQVIGDDLDDGGDSETYGSHI